MTRALISIALAVGIAAPAYADVTLKQIGEGKGIGLSSSMAITTYIKGNKMRSDSVINSKTITMIFDVDAKKIYRFESGKKEADVWDMATFGETIAKSVDMSSAQASVKPNGQTKAISGQNAAGYDVSVSMKAAMVGSKDMDMTVTLDGPLWIVKGAPGSADYSRFYAAAADSGFIFSDPNAAKAQPGQTKAMAEVYRRVAAIGGIPYEQTMLDLLEYWRTRVRREGNRFLVR